MKAQRRLSAAIEAEVQEYVSARHQLVNDAESIKAMVDANRELSLQGEVFFYDAAVTEQHALFESLYRAE